jgi:hypothetical protein
MKKHGYIVTTILLAVVVLMIVGFGSYYFGKNVYKSEESARATTTDSIAAHEATTSTGTTAAVAVPTGARARSGTSGTNSTARPAVVAQNNTTPVGFPRTGGTVAPAESTANTATARTTDEDAVIRSHSSTPSGTFEANERDVPIIIFRITAPASNDLVLTHLGIGAESGNDIFNYIENMRIITEDGRSIPVSFVRRYLDGIVLWKLGKSIVVNEGETMRVRFVADVKPGVPDDRAFVPVVNGGMGNVDIDGSARGGLLYFTR